MNDELIRTLFNPFTWPSETKARQTINNYDELVKVVRASLKPEMIVKCLQTLEDSTHQLNIVICCHKSIIEKLRKLPEVQEYLNKRQGQLPP